MEKQIAELEGTCQFFINSTNNYFSHTTKIDSHTSIPYLKNSDELVLKEYTSMIGVSGNHKGFVYISGERAMFEEIWQILTNTKATVDDALDMAGEVANVITGNVRENLGKDFMISVPMTFVGKPDRLKFHGNNLPVYVIPLTWKNHEAFVVIALSES